MSGIDTIIYDMDGVITGEHVYWDAAAFVVFELLFDRRYFGNSDIEPEPCRDICDTVLCGGDTVLAVKNLGVNTNWDLAFIIFAASKKINPDYGKLDELDELDKLHFKKVLEVIRSLNKSAPEVYEDIYDYASEGTGLSRFDFERGNGRFWKELQAVFAHWFFGTLEYKEVFNTDPPGKFRHGLRGFEKPLIPLNRIKHELQTLTNRGFTLGIGTGRPLVEAEYPLHIWDLEKFFNRDYYGTHTDIVNAERLTDTSLTKPHPFIFLKGASGGRYSDEQIINGDYDKDIIERTLIVGDAQADLLAAKAAGFKFAAVLTGIQKERTYFEGQGADYVVDNVTGISGIV